MNDTVQSKTPWHLWAVGIGALLWNAIGGYSYTMTKLGKLAELGMTPEQIEYMSSFPLWATVLWAMGVWGAIATSILLLL